MFQNLIYNTLIALLLLLGPAALMAASAPGEVNVNPNTKILTLNPAEKRIIINRGTEAPFSGKLLNNKDKGIYTCRQCGQALYKSDDKFDSGSGWPSFDAFIPGSVHSRPDPDGKRVEIICTKCKGHLGHLFQGEGFTDKNIRHCVNSMSLEFAPIKKMSTAIFAGGCFWGIEDAFSQLPGVTDVVSGYTGGKTKNPTYQQVTTGRTGHAEAVRVSYDPSRVDYETLARLFFEIHDPTQLNRQGPDRGTQYRSAIFYTDDQQKQTAQKLITILKSNGLDAVTQVNPIGDFYEAEDYHQDYTSRTGRGACHRRVKRFPE